MLGKYFPFSNSLLNKAISIHTRGGLNQRYYSGNFILSNEFSK